MNNLIDTKADREAIELLRKVDDLRAALRLLEPKLIKACLAYGSRRGMSFYREFHLRNILQAQAEQAA